LAFVAIGLAIALSVAVGLLGRRAGAPILIPLVGLIVAVGAAFGAAALESTGWRDTDGWIDCHDYCNGWHRLGAFLFWTPTFTSVLLAAGIVVALLARSWRRLRKTSGGGGI
jgi:hypothetical protein